MAISAVGTATGQTIVFNSGFLTIGTDLMVDVKDISLTLGYAVKDFFALNSIIKRAIRRSHFDGSIKCTIVGLQKDILQAFFSASSPIAAGTQYNVNDGQQNATTVFITLYENDDATKRFQFGLVNATISGMDTNLPLEDFANQAITIMFTNITEANDTTAASN